MHCHAKWLLQCCCCKGGAIKIRSVSAEIIITFKLYLYTKVIELSIELVNKWNKKYPITCLLLFDPLSICHADDECCAENCSIMLETPLCNYRSTAPCRVHDMPDDIDRYNDSRPVHILLCKMQDYHNSLVESYNVFDFQFPLRHSSFSFDIHKEDIRDLYRFLNNDILFPDNKVYPESVFQTNLLWKF